MKFSSLVAAFLLGALVTLVTGYLWFTRQPPARQARGMVAAVDAKGTLIGEVLRTDFTMHQIHVALEIDGELVPVGLRPDSFFHPAGALVYFASPDCAGDAFVGAHQERQTFGRTASIAGKDSTLYFAVQGPSRLVSARSVLRESSCEPFLHEVQAFPAKPVRHLAIEFHPPYRVARYPF